VVLVAEDATEELETEMEIILIIWRYTKNHRMDLEAARDTLSL